MNVSAKVFPGVLNSSNRKAVDWGWHGLLAYGATSLVVVADTKSVQILQCLTTHKSAVTKVKWQPPYVESDLSLQQSVLIASADTGGHVVVSDVATTGSKAAFSESGKVVGDMVWLSENNSTFLLVMYLPSTLVLYNTATGETNWKYVYSDTLTAIALDPFDCHKQAMLGTAGKFIAFVERFSTTSPPAQSMKFSVVSTASTTSSGDAVQQVSKSDLMIRLHKSRQSDTDDKKRKAAMPSDDDSVRENCLQMCYNRACRNQLLLLYPQAIVFIDLDIFQSVCTVPLDKSTSIFFGIYSCSQRNAFYCSHESGGVALRARESAAPVSFMSPTEGRKESADSDQSSLPLLSSTEKPVEKVYPAVCVSDSLRITKQQKMYGFAVCPVSELSTAIITSDGKVIIWEVISTGSNSVTRNIKEKRGTLAASTTADTAPTSQAPSGIADLSTSFLVSLPHVNYNACIGLSDSCTSSAVQRPAMSIADILPHDDSLSCTTCPLDGDHHPASFLLTGQTSGLPPPPITLKMCPPPTTKNFHVYEPLLAVGANTGIVQVWHLSTGQMVKEFSCHSFPVRGIEWTSLHSFISYAGDLSSTGGRHELAYTDVRTGKIKVLRESSSEGGTLITVKVSFLKQYAILVFKEKDMELWDLKSLSFLRDIPCPSQRQVMCMAWSPNVYKKKPAVDKEGKPQGVSRVTEDFLLTDTMNAIYMYKVKDSVCKLSTKASVPQMISNIATALAWKSEHLVLADSDGSICFWNIRADTHKIKITRRGRARKVTFAPGKGNFKAFILMEDELQVWNAQGVERLSTYRFHKEISRVNDVDWCASDKVVISISDGYAVILEASNLKPPDTMGTSLQMRVPMFCPPLLGAAKIMESARMKVMLQHQPWRPSYSLSDPSSMGMPDLNSLVDAEMRDYLTHCPYGTAERCLIVARLFGEEFAIKFWSVALHYLRRIKAEGWKRVTQPQNRDTVTDLFVPPPASASETRTTEWEFMKDCPLESSFDTGVDNDSFRRRALAKVAFYEKKGAASQGSSLLRQCAERYMLLGETDRAVHLLLDADSDQDHYYMDCLRACLLATVRSSGASQSTIKLVATNLIANGKLSEGVQLLCMIDKGLDACRYLQTYHEWEEAMWLGKVRLGHQECAEVVERWVEHLCSPSVNLKMKAIIAAMSMGQFTKVLELLYGAQAFSMASLFAEACFEFELLDSSAVIEAIFLQYARVLLSFSARDAAVYYCKKAGDQGKMLLKKILEDEKCSQ